MPGFIFWVRNRYLRPARSQVHARLHILGWKTGTCDRPGLSYLLGFIFWVRKQVPATGQVSGTCPASYFGWYLQPARSQLHPRLHILGEKTCTYDRPGRRYMPGFIFWVGKQVSATGQASGAWYFHVKSVIVIRDSIKNHSCINLRTE